MKDNSSGEQKLLEHLKKLFELYKNNKLKEALKYSNKLELDFSKDLNIPYFHNLKGLINLGLRDWEESLKNFNQAIEIDKNFEPSYFNKGIANYDLGNLDNAYHNFLKVLNIRKENHKAKDDLIKILGLININKEKRDNFSIVNNLLLQSNYKIDMKKKISNKDIIDFFNHNKKIVKKYITDLSFRENQLFIRNGVDLSCERHHKIFKEHKVIPKFCFDCFKVVIHINEVLDLIKLYLIFDNSELIKNFEKKCRIDYDNNKYRGYIYCSNIAEVYEAEKIISQNIKLNIGKKLKIETKRGCSEFSKKFPEYKKIPQDDQNTFSYKDDWKKIENEMDHKLFKNGKIIKRNAKRSLSGLSLSDFLVLNNWINYSKTINDQSTKNVKI